MKIIAEDGKEFTTTDECLEYEKQQKNNAKLKDDRYNEIISKINDIKDLIEIYNHDYGECLELKFSKPVTQFNPFDYWFPLRG